MLTFKVQGIARGHCGSNVLMGAILTESSVPRPVLFIPDLRKGVPTLSLCPNAVYFQFCEHAELRLAIGLSPLSVTNVLWRCCRQAEVSLEGYFILFQHDQRVYRDVEVRKNLLGFPPSKSEKECEQCHSPSLLSLFRIWLLGFVSFLEPS